MKLFLKVPLLLLFLLFCVRIGVFAKTHIIVDADGSVEDYAALTTIAQSSNLRDQFRLLTVSGITWGHAATVARNMCRFLSLAGLDNVVLSLGVLQAKDDAYNTGLLRGDCRHSQGFPSTPHDAMRRGMMYSRADVTSSFGAAYSLPPGPCAVRLNASDALRAALNDVSDSDTLTYFAFAGSANLAAGLRYLARYEPHLLERFKHVSTVHFFEKGYTLAVDSVSTAQIFVESGLRFFIYTPSFYDPAVCFSSASWGLFRTATKGKGASAAVEWLLSAWEKKKTVVESRSGHSRTAFFGDCGPASSLVVLCALDVRVKETCAKYPAALSRISLFLEPPARSVVGTGTLHNITGSNVTWPLYLLATLRDNRGAMQFLVARSADGLLPTATSSLASVFWSVWLDMLRPQ